MKNKARKRLLKDSYMPSRQFYIIENLLKSYEENEEKPVSPQNMIKRLEGDLAWEFYKDKSGNLHSQEVLEDIGNLHQRGYLLVRGEEPIMDVLERRNETSLLPTFKSYTLFAFVYKKDPERVNWKRRKIPRL